MHIDRVPLFHICFVVHEYLLLELRKGTKIGIGAVPGSLEGYSPPPSIAFFLDNRLLKKYTSLHPRSLSADLLENCALAKTQELCPFFPTVPPGLAMPSSPNHRNRPFLPYFPVTLFLAEEIPISSITPIMCMKDEEVPVAVATEVQSV